ncbi:MAG TPA: ABC transporter substrate-binding protein [Caulobacteraceae bacterium]|jgi:sulfonate transport system substrate-binding protein
MDARFSLSRRAALAGGAGLGLLTACSPTGRGSNSPLAGLTLRVATYKGGVQSFFQAAGVADTPYKIAYSEFAGGNLITEAINAKAIDVGSMSEIPPIFAARSETLRLIAVLQGDVNNQVTLVPKDSPIRGLADLKGKRVGYVRATTAHFFLLRLLQEQGLSFADITPIALSPQDGLAAFGRGALEAWVIYGVQSNLARARFAARVLTTAQGRLSGNYVYAALKDSIDDPTRRSAIADYLGRVKRAYAWAEVHPDALASLEAQATGVPAAIYQQQRRERSGPTLLAPVDDAAIRSQQSVADVFAQAHLIPARIDIAPLWDRTFSDGLAREG